jgi:hypothetical protein
VKRVLISSGLGFLVGLVGYLSQTLPVYLDFLAHQPGRGPVNETDAFSPWLAFTFGFGSPLWIPLGFATAALIWTAWTLWENGSTDTKFPVRLLLVYLVILASIPTLIVISDFGNIEETEEEWDWVIGWSYLLIGPSLAASYLGLRNFRRMPVLAVFATLFALFHVGTTLLDYGFYPRYMQDCRFGYDEASGTVDLDVLYFLRAAAILAAPFLAIYFIWKFLSRRRTSRAQPVT